MTESLRHPSSLAVIKLPVECIMTLTAPQYRIIQTLCNLVTQYSKELCDYRKLPLETFEAHSKEGNDALLEAMDYPEGWFLFAVKNAAQGKFDVIKNLAMHLCLNPQDVDELSAECFLADHTILDGRRVSRKPSFSDKVKSLYPRQDKERAFNMARILPGA